MTRWPKKTGLLCSEMPKFLEAISRPELIETLLVRWQWRKIIAKG